MGTNNMEIKNMREYIEIFSESIQDLQHFIDENNPTFKELFENEKLTKNCRRFAIMFMGLANHSTPTKIIINDATITIEIL